MPGQGDNQDDDDTTTGGPISYWLKYKVWGIPGAVLVLAALLIGALIGYCAK